MARNDVNLVIRAKDEAAKAFEAVASALADVLTVGNKVAAGAERTSVSLSDLAATTVALDKVYSQIVGSADRAAAAFERQAKGIAESKAQLASLKEQAAAAQAVLARLKSPDAIMEAGRNQGPRFKQIEEITRQYNLLVEAQNRVEASIRTQEASLNSGRGALQQLGSTVIAVEDAQARLAAEAVLATDAIQEQAQAVSRLTDVQRRINSITGAGRGDATGSAARSAEILAEAAARDEVIQKLKIEQERVVALAQAQEAQARVSQFLIGAGSGKSAKDSAAVFSEADAKLAEENAAILARVKKETNELTIAEDRLRAQINPLAIVQEKLNTALAEADRLYKAGRISATELAAAQKLLTGNAERARQAINGNSGLDSRGRPSLFGLKPYELTNLGYQINDLVTQVASGTSLTQALAQQGGQILQLFPRVGAAIVAALSSGPILVFVAALGTLALGVRRVLDESEKLRNFSGQLALTADGANYQAQALVASAKALDLYGLSAEEATKAVSIFVREGLNPEYIDSFGRSAQTLAKVLGIDVADAAKQLADAFTGGFDAVKKLDDATNFLSATEREYIRTLFASGDAAKARETAFQLFYDKQEEAAANMRGPWSEAVKALENAWQSFLDVLAESGVIRTVVEALETLAKGVADVLNTLSGSKSLSALQSRAETVAQALGMAIQRVDELKKQQADGNTFSDGLFPVALGPEIARGERRIAELKKELKDLAQQIFDAQGNGATGDPLAAGQGRAKQDADLARLSQERADAAAKLTQEYTDQAIAARLLRVEEEARLDLQNKFPLASNERINAEVAATVERERLKIQKEVTELKERQASAEERAVKAASKSIIGIESSGDPNAKNDASSATGLGQFIEKTWLRLFKENFPDRAKDLTDAAILALRTDSELSKQMVEIYARENAKTLQRAGQAVTEANLALAHFLGPDGAVKVLQADPNTLVSDILSPAAINANQRRLAGKTAGQVIADQQGLVDGNASPQAAAAARLVALEAERAKKQREFIEGVDQENEKRQQTTASLEAQKGLTGLALLEEQKRQAVADAVLAKQQEVDRTNADLRAKGLAEISLTQEQIKVIEELTAKQFELANAKQYAAAQRDAVQQPVDDLTAQRDALLAQIEFYQQTGQTGLAEGLEPQLAAINAQLDQAIAKAIAFYEALANNPDALAALGLTAGQVQAIADKLSTSGTGARELGREFIATGRAINEQFARGAANALDQFSQKVAAGVPVLQALKESFLQFAADFLRYIAQMIFQQIIFNLVSGGGSGGGGLGGFISGSIKHDGGTIGEPGGRSRMVSMAAFANARRMHTGGVVGFAPNEVPIIAERGETIRTKAQEEEIQRQLAAGGGGGQGAVNLKVVNAFDEAEVVSQGLNTDAGERAVLNMARRNAGAFRQALGLS